MRDATVASVVALSTHERALPRGVVDAADGRAVRRRDTRDPAQQTRPVCGGRRCGSTVHALGASGIAARLDATGVAPSTSRSAPMARNIVTTATRRMEHLHVRPPPSRVSTRCAHSRPHPVVTLAFANLIATPDSHDACVLCRSPTLDDRGAPSCDRRVGASFSRMARFRCCGSRRVAFTYQL